MSGAAFSSRHRLATAMELIANLDTLGSLSLSELLFLNDALTTMESVASALLCAPKYYESELHPNRAGGHLGQFYDLLSNYRDVLIDEAARRTPSNVTDAECRAEILILSEVRDASAIENIAGVVAQSERLIKQLRREQAQ